MNCCYSRLRIHVDIIELDTPEDENMMREQHDMLVEDERMLALRRNERRTGENTRRKKELARREQEDLLREEERTRFDAEMLAYKRFQAYQDSQSIYYIHPLTIDHQLIRSIQEEDRWKQEDARRIQEDARWKQEDLRRIQEDQEILERVKTRKNYTRRIVVKSKRNRHSETFQVRYTFQELIQRLKALETLEQRTTIEKVSNT